MMRVRLRAAPEETSLPLDLAQAERIFLWHDDLLFTLPEQADLRPQAPDVDNNGTPDAPEPEGRYSWMVTLVPAPTDVGMAAADRQFFTVSIVVFFNRDPVQDAEQVYGASFLGGGLGGGSVQLPGLPEVKEDEWIMLCTRSPRLSGALSSGTASCPSAGIRTTTKRISPWPAPTGT